MRLQDFDNAVLAASVRNCYRILSFATNKLGIGRSTSRSEKGVLKDCLEWWTWCLNLMKAHCHVKMKRTTSSMERFLFTSEATAAK